MNTGGGIPEQSDLNLYTRRIVLAQHHLLKDLGYNNVEHGDGERG